MEADLEKAFRFYKEAVDTNFPFSDFEVEKFCETGFCIEINLAKAQEYDKKALDGFEKKTRRG